jgi:hypothetical protein
MFAQFGSNSVSVLAGCDSDDEILLPGLSASAVMTALQKFDLKSLPLRSKVMRCRSLMYLFITILNNVDRLVTRDETCHTTALRTN